MPDDVPERLEHLIRRCLTKDPRRRLHDIADARIEIEDTLASPLPVRRDADVQRLAASSQSARQRLPWILLALAALALIVVSALALRSSRRAEPATTAAVKFTVVPPGAVAFSPTAQFVSMSPDGRYLAFVATNSSGVPIVWIRARDSLEPQALPGTEGARQPFWSPDSRFVGYFAAGGFIKKVPVTGGPSETLVSALATGTGATWNRDGVILFSATASPIQRIDASGGTRPVAVTSSDDFQKQVAHSFPHFLPDGKRFLYYVRSFNPEQDGIYVRDLDGGPPRLVIHASSNVSYVPSGHLLYVRDGVLMAHPFDANSARTTGDPAPIAERVEIFTESGIAAFSASDTGALVYRSSSELPASRLIWFDRSGKRLGGGRRAGAVSESAVVARR
jgi:hypothetical protein